MAKPRRVFLSYTSELREFPAGQSFVDAAERAVARSGDVVTDAMSLASTATPQVLSEEQVRSSDVYVGLIGFRYGSPVRDQPDMSYIELQFQAATDAAIPRLVIMLDENAVLPIPAARLMEVYPACWSDSRRSGTGCWMPGSRWPGWPALSNLS